MRHDVIEADAPRPHWKTVRENAAPPPAKRPKCPECGKPLAPQWEQVSQTGNSREGWTTIVRWAGRYSAYGHFDTLRCAAAWANREYAKRHYSAVKR